MFKHRAKQTLFEKFCNVFWPSVGWKHYVKYLFLRLSRLKGSPRSLAVGIACGVAISFTPFVGFHIVLAAITAFLLRGNVLASALGTVAGNPWTFPFIWISILYTGRKILGAAAVAKVDFMQFFKNLMHALMTFDFSLFFSDIWPILWPMMVGCIPYYIVSWFITYFFVKSALENINSYRKNKMKD